MKLNSTEMVCWSVIAAIAFVAVMFVGPAAAFSQECDWIDEQWAAWSKEVEAERLRAGKSELDVILESVQKLKNRVEKGRSPGSDEQEGTPTRHPPFSLPPGGEAERLKRIAALDLPQHRKRSLQDGRIWIGASKEHACLAWGKPVDVNRTITAYSTSEQWVYSGYNYLYFENGVVQSIQN